MKKIFRISVICVLALASVTGCKKETFRYGDGIVFRAGTAATKAAYSGVVSDGAERIDWVSGDLVRISCEQASAPTDKWSDYKTNGGTAEGSVSTSFLTPSAASGLQWGTGTHQFYAVYPSPATSSSAVTAMDGAVVTASVPAVQTVSVADPVEGSYITTPDLSKSMLMVAYNSIAAESYEKGGVLLNFQPVTTALEFTITNSTEADLEVADIYLTSENHPLSGAYTATIGTDGSVTVVAAGDAGKAATAEPATAFTVANGKTFRITVFLCPQDNLDDLVFHITSSDGKERYTKLQKSNGDIVTFKKSVKTYVSGLFVPAGAVWQVNYDSDVDSWGDIDGGDVDLTDPSLEMGEMFVTSWDEVDKGDPGLHFAPEPVCFTAAAPQTVRFERNGKDGNPAVIYYSYDKMSWTKYVPYTDGDIAFGGTEHPSVYFKGMNAGFVDKKKTGTDAENPAFIFGDNTVLVNGSGNMMSLYNYVDEVTTSANFQAFFLNAQCLVSAPELPSEKVTTYGYLRMFKGCISLTNAPELPVTDIASACYDSMFQGCTNLSVAPELPATILAQRCYSRMFSGCTNLSVAPELPAMALADECYYSMFSGCTNLSVAPELPATTLASGCYLSMFYDCNNLTSAPELPATTLASRCYSSMFYDCKGLTSAPTLPATILTESCYEGMFHSCTSLTTAPELPATTLAKRCYNCMFQFCRNLNYVKMLATDINATDCLQSWTSNVASSGTFVKAAGVEIPVGQSGIPEGWNVVEVNE